MKAEVKILVEYNPTDDHVLLSSRGVEGDGLPLNIYIGVLQALSRMQEQYNGRQLEIALTPPSEISIASEVPERPSCIGVPAVSKDETSTPPTPKTVVTTNKMRKAYTEEEKNEIAQLYQDGLQVNEIARRFGRKPESIYKLVSSMGVKRNQKREYEKPEVIAASDASDQPKAKRECTLKKPWYLQPQRPNNRTKAKHE
jgi:transposase-like protein